MAQSLQPAVAAPRQGHPDGAAEASAVERCVYVADQHWRWFLAAMLLCDAALLLYMGRGLTFFYDEWNFVTADFGGGLHSILAGHVGNISVFPVLVYKALFHLAGLNHYPVYRLAVIVLHLLAGTLVFALSARRIGHAPALLAAALILFLGAAWEDLLWPFQIGYLLSITGGLGAWLLLERRDRWGDLAAMACVIVAAGSSSLGIAIIIGLAVELAWQRAWRRGWIVAVPAVLYVLWYLGYGESQITRDGLINAPGFALELMASAFGALVGRALEWGRPLAVLGVLVVARRLSRPVPIPPRLAGLLGAGLCLWIMTAVARSTISAPEASRYTYLGAVVIVLSGVELLNGVAIAPRAVAVGAVLVAVAAATGLTVMRDGADGLRGDSSAVAAELGALEVAAAYAPPGYQPDTLRAPQILAGPYLHTVRAIGSSPADTPSRIASADATSRSAADGVLIALEAPAVTPQSGAVLPAPAEGVRLQSVTGGSQRAQGGCVLLSPVSPGTMTAVLDVGHAGVTVANRGAGPASVAFRRFGEEFHPVEPPVPPRGAARLTVRPDALAVPWQAQVSSASPLVACG